MALTTAQAQAQCAAQSLGPSACADLVAPTCAPGQGVRIELGKPPFCANETISPAKAAALLKEAQATAAANAVTPTWVFVAGGLVVVGGLAWLLLR